MLQNILNTLNIDLGSLLANAIPVMVPMLVSTIMGFLIYFVYTKTFKGVVFNHGFSITVALMSILTTAITLAISTNIALSLGMVGALSIVRYRTAVKDPMDLLFLFWAVTTGVTTGARMHHLAVLSAIMVIIALLLITRYDPLSKMYVIIVNYSGEDIDDELRRILRERNY